jgi:outer membrane murein-binding lipoprotein Lpp
MNMLRYLTLAALLSTTVWVAGCQDSSAQDAKIAALNSKVNELESQMGDRSGTGTEAKVKGTDGDLSDLRNRLDKLDRENADLKKLLADQNSKLSDVNKSIESLGGEVSASGAAQTREEKKKEMAELQAEIDKERREKQAADRKAQMDAWVAKAKEAGIEIDPNDPMGSGMKAWQDPVQREKLMNLMKSEFRKSRNEKLKLDEVTAQKLDTIEDDTMTKMQDINKRRTDGTITREQAQTEMAQTMTDADNQTKNTLTEEQYKGYKESVAGMGAGMMGGMGGMGGMIPGMGGGGRGGR